MRVRIDRVVVRGVRLDEGRSPEFASVLRTELQAQIERRPQIPAVTTWVDVVTTSPLAPVGQASYVEVARQVAGRIAGLISGEQHA